MVNQQINKKSNAYLQMKKIRGSIKIIVQILVQILKVLSKT